MVHSRNALIPDDDLSALIARLEAAEAGSRELDALVWLRFNRPEYSGGVKALEMRGWYDGRGHMILETDMGEEVADDLGIGTYTTSLDAALALAERVLPGWRKFVEVVGDGRGSACVFLAHEAIDRPWFHAPTPALALCISILRAIPNGYEAAGEVSPNLKAKAQGEGG